MLSIQRWLRQYLVNIFNLIEYYFIGDSMNIVLYFIIAISLSMDAFSLSLAYGTLSLKKQEIIILSIVVGLYHFFMPIFGGKIGYYITSLINLGTNITIFIIFSIIGINMIIDGLKKNTKVKKMHVCEMLVFGFAVSLDSFTVGIGLNNINNNYIISSLIFCMTSFIFTYFGLILGKKLNLIIGNIATLIGGFTLIILGITYIV